MLGEPAGIGVEDESTLGPPVTAVINGMRKYSAIACKSLCGTTEISHITKKNAIIAVTKSAYAIFQLSLWPSDCSDTVRRITMRPGGDPLISQPRQAFLPESDRVCRTWSSSSMNEGRTVRSEEHTSELQSLMR